MIKVFNLIVFFSLYSWSAEQATLKQLIDCTDGLKAVKWEAESEKLYFNIFSKPNLSYCSSAFSQRSPTVIDEKQNGFYIFTEKTSYFCPATKGSLTSDEKQDHYKFKFTAGNEFGYAIFNKPKDMSEPNLEIECKMANLIDNLKHKRPADAMNDSDYTVVECKNDLSDPVKELLVKKIQRVISATFQMLKKLRPNESPLEVTKIIATSFSKCDGVASIKDYKDYQNIMSLQSQESEKTKVNSSESTAK